MLLWLRAGCARLRVKSEILRDLGRIVCPPSRSAIQSRPREKLGRRRLFSNSSLLCVACVCNEFSFYVSVAFDLKDYTLLLSEIGHQEIGLR